MKYSVLLSAPFLLLFNINVYSQSGWFQQNSGTSFNLYSVFPVDAITVYAVGDSTEFSRHIILKSTDGGTSWVRQSPLPPMNNYPLLSIFFLDANTGWACGGPAPYVVVYRTTNGGTNWNLVYSDATFYGMRSIYFLNSLTGIGVGSAYASSGYIFRTTNGGTNWTNVMGGAGTVLYSVYFTDINTGYVCGDPGVVYKTTNSGLNWVQLYTYPAQNLRSIQFINASTGWTVGTDSRVYKTTNGATFTMFYNQGLCGLYSVYFNNEQTGWVCGCEGAINGSTNNGASWTLQSFATTTYLYSIRFATPTIGWAVGAGGRILKTTTGGITFIQPVSNEVPEAFKLYQNYPNPFNASTKFKFQISKLADVKVNVFDILGREVATLVNEQLRPGPYEVDFDGMNFHSGVYYYKLTAGDYVETKKMVLLK